MMMKIGMTLAMLWTWENRKANFLGNISLTGEMKLAFWHVYLGNGHFTEKHSLTLKSVYGDA
jgi:hypothetical protein